MSPANEYYKPGQQRFIFAGMCTTCGPDAQPEGKIPLAINVHAYLDDAITPRLPQGAPLVTLVPSAAVHSLRRMNDTTATLSATASGPLGVGTGTDVPVGGGVAWSNPGNITVEDAAYASVTLTSPTGNFNTPNNQATISSQVNTGSQVPWSVDAQAGPVAHAFSTASLSTTGQLWGRGYGFSIPSTATILGIQVQISRAATGGQAHDTNLFLLKGNVQVGVNHAAPSTIWTNGFTTATYGSATDLWGTTWTPAEINATNSFGAFLQAFIANVGGDEVIVDFIKITVFYSAASATVVSDQLQGTNFGFAIPGGTTIAGIKVEVKGFQTQNFAQGNTSALISVGLMQGGVLVTPLFPQQLPTANGFIGFGGPANLWLPSPTWTPALINAANFGVVIQAQELGPAVTFNIDFVRITVYYFTSSPVSGFVLVSGSADKVFVNATQVQAGMSQNRLAMVPFRPNNSVRPWMYIGDSNKLIKVQSDNTTYKTGIKEPQAVPTLALSGAGPLTGDEFYAYSYRSSLTGAQSNLSPISPVSGANDIVTAANAVSVTCTASTDPQVDLIDIWRFGVGLLQYTYIATILNSSTTYIDSLSDLVVANNPIATFDNYEPFPSIDIPQLGTLTVSNGPFAGTKTCTWASGANQFNLRWLGGTIVTLSSGAGSTQVTLFARPTSATVFVGIIQPPGATLANGTYTYNITAPNLAAQPLPALWGPTDNAAFMFACGDPLRPGTLYFTKGNQPDSAPLSNQIDVTSPSEPLIGGAIVGGLGIVMSTERGWLLYPNFAQATATVVGVAGQPFQPIETITERGLWAKEGICTDGGGNVYFVAKDGIRVSPGGSGSQSITDDIDNLFPHEGQVQKPYTLAGFTVSPPDYTQTNAICLRFSQGYVYFDYTGLDNTAHTLKYHIRKKAWSVDIYSAVATVHADNEGQGTIGSTGALPAIGVLTGCVDSTIRALQSSAGTETGSVMTVLTPCVGGVTRPVKHFGDLYIETSMPPSSPTQFLLNPWINRYENNVGALSIGAVPVPVTYRGGQIVDINAGQGIFAQDLALQITGPVTAPALSNDGTTLVYAALFLWEPTLIEQPETIGERVTDWDDAGYPGAKFVQGLIVEADSSGAVKQFQVRSGEDQSLHVLAEMGAGVVFNNQSKIAFSFAQPFITHNMRLEPLEAVPWRLFSIQWVFVPVPELCNEWHTEGVGHGLKGWQHIKEVNIEHISTTDLTLTLIADTGAQVTLTIPNSGGVQAKTLVAVPSQWTNGANPGSPKFKLVSYNFTSLNPFRVWKEDLEVKVGQWGRSESYQIMKPFGGQSDSMDAQV